MLTLSKRLQVYKVFHVCGILAQHSSNILKFGCRQTFSRFLIYIGQVSWDKCELVFVWFISLTITNVV